MNQELKRIRQKDFAKIDQTLFQNVSRTDNINSTLTHLSEFQKFLMEQISVLNSSTLKSAKDNRISESLVKNFDNLKESLIKCSQIRQKASKTKFIQLKKKITQLKQYHQGIIKQIYDQNIKLFELNKQKLEIGTRELIKKYQTQRQRRHQIQIKYNKLQTQLIELKKSHAILKSMIQPKQNVTKIETKSMQPLQINNGILIQLNLNKESQHQKQISLNQSLQQNGWKIMRDKIAHNNISGYTSIQKKQQIAYHYSNTPIKRSNSNHKLPCKTHLVALKQKQNSSHMITKNDVIQNLKRGKSKQKIKVFSMF